MTIEIYLCASAWSSAGVLAGMPTLLVREEGEVDEEGEKRERAPSM